MYLNRKFGLSLSFSEITSLFDLSLDLDRTFVQRKAQRKAKSKVKVDHWLFWLEQLHTAHHCRAPSNSLELNPTDYNLYGL